MKILLLPAYFYPEQMSSSHLDDNRYLAFAKNGIQMECYTPMPTRGINAETRHIYKKRKYEKLYSNRMEVFRFSMYEEGKNPISRALRYIFCWCTQFCKGLLSKDIDLIYLVSTPPIQGMLGGLLKKIKKVPFVYNLQDIFPDSLVGTGLAKKDGVLWKIGRVIEDFTYRNADKIIVISEDFKRNIMEKGVPEDKIEVVYNWVDEEAVHPISRDDNEIFEELGLSRDKFYVVYAGNLGNAQNVEILLNAAQLLKDNSSIQFVIFGTGGLKECYIKIAQENNLENIHFFPLQPYEKVSQVYSLGDVCVVSCKKGLGGSAMPSKTWSIMSSGTAVLANFDEGDLKSILEKNLCGIFTNAGDVKSVADAILTLYNNHTLCEEMGRNGRQFILNNLTRAVGTQKYVNIIKSFKKTRS